MVAFITKIKHLWWITGKNGQIQPPANQSRQKFRKKVRLIGAADDRGVYNVGGRLGASQGPSAVRKLLSEFMSGMTDSLEKVQIFEGFDVELGDTIQDGHAALRKSIAANLKAEIIPTILGGGHDYGFPHIAGVSDFFGSQNVALINIDPHLDVRPPNALGVTSGSPFYLALEEGVLLPKNFYEFGIQEHCNDKNFLDYAINKKVNIITLEKLRSKSNFFHMSFEKLLKSLIKKKLKIVVSFDLDAVQQAFSPGVSSPQSDGFTSSEFLKMAELCGKYSNDVVSIGFFELAPALDHQQLSTRLVATALHRYLTALVG